MASDDSSNEQGALIGSNGLPEMTKKEVKEGWSGALKLIAVLMLVTRLICFTIAFLIYYYGDRTFFDSQIAVLTGMHWGYVYIGVGIFSLLVHWLNLYPMAFKGKIMLQNSGNMRANMSIYKVNLPDTEKQLPYVVLEEEGDVGEYNRANRSLFHFNENAAGFLLNFVFAGGVFPFPAMIIIIVFAVGRALHQQGYSKGYGSHGAGFALAMISTITSEGLVWVVAAKSLGVF